MNENENRSLSHLLFQEVMGHCDLGKVKNLLQRGAQHADIFFAACDQLEGEALFNLMETLILGGHPLYPGDAAVKEAIIKVICASSQPYHDRANFALEKMIEKGGFDTSATQVAADISSKRLKTMEADNSFHAALEFLTVHFNTGGIRLLLESCEEDPLTISKKLSSQKNFHSLPMIAARHGNIESLDYLLSVMPEDQWPCKVGSRSPLICHAAQSGHGGLIEYLIERGYDVNATNTTKTANALETTINIGHDELTKTLIDLGADLNGSENGNVPLHTAIRRYKEDTFHLLLMHGADIHKKDSDGYDSIFHAINSDAKWAIEPLFALGANVQTRNLKGQTLLHVATFAEDADMINSLLDRGVDINANDENGETSLMIAAKLNCPDLAVLLIDRGADIYAKDEKGRTALELAPEDTRAAIEAHLLHVQTPNLARSLVRRI